MDHWLTQIDPFTSGWTRNTDGELVPLWFSGQRFPDELMKPAKRKAPMTQNPVCNEETPPSHHHPQRFSALVANCTLQDWIESNDDCFTGNEEDESDTGTSDHDSDSGDSDEKCTPDHPKHRALNSLHDIVYHK